MKSNRTKALIALLIYMTGCSAFFGAVFAGRHLFVGLATLMIAQGAAAYVLLLVRKTEPK